MPMLTFLVDFQDLLFPMFRCSSEVEFRLVFFLFYYFYERDVITKKLDNDGNTCISLT